MKLLLAGIISRIKPGDKTVTVDIFEFEALMKEHIDVMPTPPILSKKETIQAGFFSRNSRTEVEYDHHAPAYLKAMEQWNENLKTYKQVQITGPYGAVTVVIEDRDQ